jgi:hypothetical protein
MERKMMVFFRHMLIKIFFVCKESWFWKHCIIQP